MTKSIYLDYHATTPVDPRVLNVMLPFFGPKFGNAASGSHSFGWEAEGAVEVARKRIASLANARAEEIVFTSGATESDNLAIKGVVTAAGVRGAHIVATLDEASYEPVGMPGQNLRMGSDHPIAWTRCVGQGRSFYSAIGHRPEVYSEPHYRLMLENAIGWAATKGACAR